MSEPAWPAYAPPPSAPTAWPAPGQPAGVQPGLDPWHLSFAGLLASEVRKLTTLTSTWVLVAISFALGAYTTATTSSFARIFCEIVAEMTSGRCSLLRLSEVLYFAPICPGALMAILGVLSISNEYASGMIRTTLAAAPSRWPALAAKATAVAATAGLTALLSTLVGSLIALATSDQATSFDLFTAAGLRAWLGGSLVVLLMGLLGLGLGTLVRSTAGGIVSYFGLMVILPLLVVLGMAAAGTTDDAARWTLLHLPPVAPFGVYTPILETLARSVIDVPITTGGAVVTTLVWTLVPLAFGFWAFQRRDA